MIKNQVRDIEKPHKQRISRLLDVGIGRCILIFLLFALIVPVHAEFNDCEKLAKEYQRVYGGDLILVQPLKSNGAYDLGEYNGHWMNKAWSKALGSYYYDSFDKSYYYQIESVKLNFKDIWNKDVVVLDYNKGEVQFGIIWHY